MIHAMVLRVAPRTGVKVVPKSERAGTHLVTHRKRRPQARRGEPLRESALMLRGAFSQRLSKSPISACFLWTTVDV